MALNYAFDFWDCCQQVQVEAIFVTCLLFWGRLDQSLQDMRLGLCRFSFHSNMLQKLEKVIVQLVGCPETKLVTKVRFNSKS
eukprot:5935744-Amphidinium_carterae.1